MKRQVHLEPVLRRIPPEAVPVGLERLAEVARATPLERGPWFHVGWSNPGNLLRLRPAALRELVPFLRLGDGGTVALWLTGAEPAVVFLGSEGESRVLGADMAGFLAQLASGTTGVPALHDALPQLGAPAEAPPGVPAALVTGFADWVRASSALRHPVDSKRAEALRRALFSGARALVRDGLQRPHTLTGGWWSVSLNFLCFVDGWSVERQVRGKWLAVPPEYTLAAEGPALRAVYGRPRKTRFAVQVNDSGLVTVERDMELEGPPRPRGG